MSKEPAKGVILRVPENDMDYHNLTEFVDSYFTKCPFEAATDPARHFVHYQPPTDRPEANMKIHIVINMETQDFSGETVSKNFPHDVYAARRAVSEL
ncbi:hypothetical protein BDW74DRAFT_144693 [Aspergillus multicolor]|uniref:uncharacterized protein n=1 Tax=Aspergillus multicolor TaxID=41759 RepID=UPI003CCDE52B